MICLNSIIKHTLLGNGVEGRGRCAMLLQNCQGPKLVGTDRRGRCACKEPPPRPDARKNGQSLPQRV
eukprot:3608622-Alexandrium_andersonii.AAC.1